jgi:hypothetical protein
MSLEQEVERLRAENTELRRLLAAGQAHTAELTQPLAVALERIIELEAQVNQPKDRPAFVKPKRKKAEGEPQPRKKRAAVHNTSPKRA